MIVQQSQLLTVQVLLNPQNPIRSQGALPGTPLRKTRLAPYNNENKNFLSTLLCVFTPV